MSSLLLRLSGFALFVLSHLAAADQWQYAGFQYDSVPEEIALPIETDIKGIAAGFDHTVALKQDGTIISWGNNFHGQTSIPAGLTGIIAIAAGPYYTVALKQDGTVAAWGLNEYGQTTVPVGLTGVTAIAAGGSHTVALKQNGTVVAWGQNSFGQTTVPAGLTGVTAIAGGGGGSHTAALKQNGTVVAWGLNNHGQTTVPAGLTGVTAIAAGWSHTVALKQDGSVVAWGRNDEGQTAVPAGLTGVIAIAAGYTHTVVLKQDGTVVAWGANEYGQTLVPAGLTSVTSIAAHGHTVVLKQDGTLVVWGFNQGGQIVVPVGLTGVTVVSAGINYMVALKQDGTVVAWGANEYGQTTVPAGLSDVTAIAAEVYHTVALRQDGTVVAWGDNFSNQTAVPVGLTGVIAIAAGYSHTVALKQDGTVVAWGRNSQTAIPAGLTGVTAIAAGWFHTVALKQDGTVASWGSNNYGQTAVPAGLTGVTAIAAGESHTVALKQDGTIVAWGRNNHGQTAVPAGLTGVTAIAAGESHTVALKQDGTVVAWGNNFFGQTTVPSWLTGVTAVAAGDRVTFYRLPSDAGPEVQQVGAGTIPAINGKQPVIIAGAHFHPDCSVTLRDHRTGEVFPNRAKLSQTTYSIQLNVNFTSVPAEWSVEVTNPDGISSGRFRFQVGTPVVPGETVEELVIPDPGSIGAGETATFSAILHYTDGSELDVTGSATFRIVGQTPEGVSLLGNELRTDPFTPTSTVLVSASFGTTSGGIEATSPRSVSIGGGFHAKIFSVIPESDPFTIRATASVTGAGGPYTYSWDFDGDGAFDDGPNHPWTLFTYPSIAGMQTVKVKVVSSTTGEEKVAEKPFRLSKMLAVGQPIRPKAVNVSGLGNFYDKAGDPFEFKYDRIGNGLVVLVHGMNSNGQALWLGDLGRAIEGAITNRHDSSALPNIVIYDWRKDAATFLVELLGDGNDINDITDITASGIIHGGHLANWLRTQAIAGLVDPQAPIHLIGHSAGGFVIGQAATSLAPGILVDRVTMLDTPKPWPQHLRDLKTNGTFVDRLITSNWGSRNYLNAPLPDGYTYTQSTYPSPYVALVNYAWNEWGHGLAYRRYEHTATVGHEDFLTTGGVTFRNSPFILGPLNPNRPAAAMVPSGMPMAKKGPRIPPTENGEQAITSLSSYGATEQAGGVHTLIENGETDSGVHAQLAVPIGAYAVSFSYRFQEGDEEDRFVASAGNEGVLFIAPNLPLYRTREFQGWLEVAEFAGSTVTLDFRLEGTGAANTRVAVSDIKFLTYADVDQDGLENSLETSLGSNPLNPDSDGDGLSDHTEVNVYFTSPTRADTDSDGVDDAVEVEAGTDPMSSASVFRITEISHDSEGNVRVAFPCAPGKTYRLLGSKIPYGLTNWTIESGIQSDSGSATVIDAGRRISDTRFFYWAEVELAE